VVKYGDMTLASNFPLPSGNGHLRTAQMPAGSEFLDGRDKPLRSCRACSDGLLCFRGETHGDYVDEDSDAGYSE